MNLNSDISIHRATTRDLRVIATWLARKDRSVAFYNNIDDIRRGIGNTSLYVMVQAGDVVAFALGLIDILWVRPDMRKRGIGRRLAEDCFSRARQRGMLGLRIQCRPPTSVPFWETMGFAILQGTDAERGYAVRCLPGQNALPEDGKRVGVRVRLLDSRTECMLVPAFVSEAAELSTGGYLLRDQYIGYYGLDYDALLCVDVDGKNPWRVKAKYSEKIGGEHAGQFVAINRLLPPM